MGKRKRPSRNLLEDVMASDIYWTQLMGNRLFIREIFAAMLDNSNVRDEMTLLSGIAAYGRKLDHLRDPYTYDLIDVSKNNIDRLSERDNESGQTVTQTIYPSISSYFRYNSPRDGKVNVYYIGDADDDIEEDKKSTLIHWNAVIVDRQNNVCMWLDPDETLGIFQSYNFREQIRYFINNEIRNIVPNIRILMFKMTNPMQVMCTSDHPAVDVFCQTWVVILTSGYFTGTLGYIYNLPYETIQHLMVKLWAKCMLQFIDKSWYNEKLKYFINYIRFYDKNNDVCTTKRVPDVIDCGSEHPFIYSFVIYIRGVRPSSVIGSKPSVPIYDVYNKKYLTIEF